MGSSVGPFGPGLLRFLRELDRNNHRPWFDENRERYEAEVREPARDFIRAMAPEVEGISPYLLADDRRIGGSLMRIYRDVRFSPDKRPFKTNLGIQFRHEAGKDVHAPGLYFHVEPRAAFLGAGMWRPDPQSLAAVRETIDRKPGGWKRVRDGKGFRTVWELSGDSLKRPPRGYEADHPMIEDLKRKDCIAVCSLTERDVTRTDLVEFVADRFARARGYLAWLADAIGMPF